VPGFLGGTSGGFLKESLSKQPGNKTPKIKIKTSNFNQNKSYCSDILLDVAQGFDKVWQNSFQFILN